MDDCLFCKIINGDVPSYPIYEDENFLAFLDAFPAVEGYTLVIPKEHYRWVWDVPNMGDYFEVVRKVAKNIQEVTGNDAVYVKILGQEVPHAHIRIFPTNDHEFIDKYHSFIGENRPEKIMDPQTGKKLQEKYRVN